MFRHKITFGAGLPTPPNNASALCATVTPSSGWPCSSVWLSQQATSNVPLHGHVEDSVTVAQVSGVRSIHADSVAEEAGSGLGIRRGWSPLLDEEFFTGDRVTLHNVRREPKNHFAPFYSDFANQFFPVSSAYDTISRYDDWT